MPYNNVLTLLLFFLIIVLIGKTETEKISRIETTDKQRENTQTEQIIKTTPWDNLDGKKYTEKNGK